MNGVKNKTQMQEIAASLSAEVEKYQNTISSTSGHWSSITKRFARYDLLLVFASYLESKWNRC